MTNCEEPYKPPYTVEDEDPNYGMSSSSSSADDNTASDENTIDGSGITVDLREISELCNEVGLSPDMITGVFINMLVQHFGCPAEIYTPELKNYTWHPNPALRKIHFVPLNDANYVQSGHRPAIIYTELDQQASRFAIGDQGNLDQQRGPAQSYARAWQGAHRFLCVGTTSLQASLLAKELTQYFTEFGPWLLNHLPFHDFQVVDRSAPRNFSELGDHVGVALTVRYAYIWAWELVPDGPLLKDVSLNKE